MVELRKRKTPPVAPPKPARKKSSSATPAPAPKPTSKVAKVKETVKNVVKPASKEDAPVPAAAAAETKPVAGGLPTVGSTIDIATFGGEVETHEGVKTTLAKLLAESKAGIVIFTYPKQNTPGCTRQACSFRDSYDSLTATGLSIYGLSTDAPKGNKSFRDKFSFPYTLLCDPKQVLIKPLGFGKAGTAHRGVFVVTPAGKVLANEKGGPEPTVDVVRKIVASMGGADATAQKEATQEEKETAKSAAEVADTAATLDGTPQPTKA
ncbi:AhpC-TSA-domain-containing protein [Pseudovirgaria hyperparasitica]|uniref:thioredoxin-dependent peroxiredoxin n=1 Tax=Pseudovirgaria hyperparasitica TaxID=470096 RepID=A0A6A6WAB6_9PEZI|nr:AhpC-TSA-domain-containing protein [Pseudovirgaria hyperparasitica]KAF2759515.1 AhpC-TSA-domain-containing protein [Pseudovirgaria hyperparasitica]